ncbi:hypothetical protein ACNKHO_21435 [Shigella flexneri]
MGILPQIVTHFRQQRGIFGKTLHQNIAGTVQRGFAIGDAFIGINISPALRRVGRIGPQQIRQRFKTGFNGDLPRVRRFGL